MPLSNVEETLKKALDGIVTEKVGDTTYIPIAGISTLTHNSMSKIIRLSSDPEHAANFQSINEQVYIEEGFLYTLFREEKIAQDPHKTLLQRFTESRNGIELKTVNIDAPQLKR